MEYQNAMVKPLINTFSDCLLDSQHRSTNIVEPSSKIGLRTVEPVIATNYKKDEWNEVMQIDAPESHDDISKVSTSPKGSTKSKHVESDIHSENLSRSIIRKTLEPLKNSETSARKWAKAKRKISNKVRKPKPEISKSRYHYEVNNQDLSKRKDVVNKTLLRSLKRYYTCIFPFDIIKYLKSQKAEITAYTNHNKKPMTMGSVKTLIEIVRAPANLRPCLKNKYDQNMWDDFHAWLYKYSHTKLYELLKLPQVKYLVKDYLTTGLESMLANDDTLKKNPDVYRNAGNRFMDIINS
jgi:hypothetical protein